ncbi:MAG TPA: hypothetical protein DDZ32_06020 [Gammaproteobacteria bacterium]|nr:hypothetical protein [Gammaproteobacteria bacterium]HBF62101.1 hypothetical protein [Gammaproteobacteria bacterium]HBK12376.1 hypothetical protein [Gammaproteobacteria bacterium]
MPLDISSFHVFAGSLGTGGCNIHHSTGPVVTACLFLGALILRWGLIILPVQPAAGLTQAAPEGITDQSSWRSLPNYCWHSRGSFGHAQPTAPQSRWRSIELGV